MPLQLSTCEKSSRYIMLWQLGSRFKVFSEIIFWLSPARFAPSLFVWSVSFSSNSSCSAQPEREPTQRNQYSRKENGSSAIHKHLSPVPPFIKTFEFQTSSELRASWPRSVWKRQVFSKFTTRKIQANDHLNNGFSQKKHPRQRLQKANTLYRHLWRAPGKVSFVRSSERREITVLPQTMWAFK